MAGGPAGQPSRPTPVAVMAGTGSAPTKSALSASNLADQPSCLKFITAKVGPGAAVVGTKSSSTKSAPSDPASFPPSAEPIAAMAGAVPPQPDEPSLVEPVSMASDPTNQPLHTKPTALTAGPKPLQLSKPPPANLVKIFQDQNLQKEITEILQHHKPSHSNQIFVPYEKSQILGPYFVSPPPAALAFIFS